MWNVKNYYDLITIHGRYRVLYDILRYASVGISNDVVGRDRLVAAMCHYLLEAHNAAP